ncbi:disease resistance protein RGA5-like isoform X4 [Miscanthus floridulus]|uniref:disease resistance protein RGA5-like isoform X4 n=1 Tax=Miscanthus floridulus TaxID=154761 RepID=UPI0034585AA6
MAVVLGAMGKLAPKLLQLLQSEYELQKNVKRKVEFVTRELESIEAALHKVAAVPWDQLDEQVKVWARQVRDASYDMEDVLDTFLLHVEGGEPVNHGWLKRAMKKMSGLVGKFKARRDITSAIDGIEKQLQEVADSRDRYKIVDIVANPAPATTVDPRLSAYYTKASQLVGIDEPRDKLIEMLSIREGDRSSNEMKIISIVGFGGLGKTTLAKAVYDKVYHQFDCGAFVPVGRNPDPKKVLRDILIDLINGEDEKPFFDQYNGRNTVPDLMPLDEWQLIIKLRKFIKGKRYCIVIDDIWDEKTWEVIRNAFGDSNPRSRIIATTRNSKVSEEIGKVYRMEKLPESQSRKLLYTRTFGAEEKWPGNNDELAVVSQKILHRCDGVPLAIITIGSLLAGKQIEEWSNVYDSVGFGHGDDPQVNNMKKILSFSYYDLPCHLRTCMLYLTVYPEDSSINNDDLIYRWIAEGLVQTEEGKEPFKDSKQWSQGSDVRRLALHRAEHIEVNDRDVPKLRSFNAIWCVTDNIPPVSRFKLLRVLFLEGCRPLEGHLDTEYLGKLLHLRYLALVDTPIRQLSKKIGHLKFLQTLDLTRTGVEELPTSTKQLTKLMCLRADDKTRVPDWICELTSLAELSIQGADGDRCLIKELGKLRNLRTLCIGITLQDEGEVRGFLEALSNLEKIEAISVQTSKPFDCKDAVMQPSFVLHCNNLRVLLLFPLVFSKLPKWINPQALPKLCRLTLKLSILYQQDVEILGKFQNLCSLGLQVSGFSSKISIVGGGRFQNLRYFGVAGLCPLEFVRGAVPRLEDIWLLIPVRRIFNTSYDLGLKFGLGNISALQAVEAVLDCACCLPREVEEVEAELRHTVSIHPNRPTLQITRTREDEMVTSSDSVVERQKKRERRLGSQIAHLKTVHNAMIQEVLEMGDIKIDLNPSDAKNKVQGFHQLFSETYDRVQHKLLPVQEDTPIHDRDLAHHAPVEDIKAMEQALEILTVQYPRLAAMLDELRYMFSLQGAMPMPHVLNLNIRVFDIMVDKLGLDLGLLGKISSLQGIKAHVICDFCFPTEVEEVEAELRQAVEIHHPNNPPTLEIIRYAEDRMVKSDSDSQMLLERQKCKRTRLVDQVNHQIHLQNTLNNKVVEIVEQKTNTTLRDAAKHKEQRFREHFNAIKDRVAHELLRVYENIPNPDLKRLTEEIEDTERALQILTVEYPRLAAMLEELITALGLEAEDEDEDEVTDDKEASATSLSEEVVFAASVSETNGEEVSAASLSGREEEKKRRRRPWQSPYPTEKRRMR